MRFMNSLNSPSDFRATLLRYPDEIETVRSIYPPVVDAMLGDNNSQFVEEFRIFCNLIQMQQYPNLSASSLNVDTQRRIADEIERRNIDENMVRAMEETPESFIQVAMLWINMKVNGHRVKAFVDTGAQMTIMSVECARRCDILRLVDRRWEGLAMGVGTQRIVGRVHLAQIQIERTFLQCSFSILEDQPMDVLLGLDMLRRHYCVINLGENALVIGSTNTRTHFLPEREIPSYGQLPS